MASDIFAKIGDIKGESLDDKHKDEIEVLSFSWGVTNAGVISAGGGGGAGKATFQDLSIVHNIDKASPQLLKACATGTHLKDATITHRKAGKGQQEFLIVKMNDVIITGVTHGGAAGQPAAETVSLAFAKVDLEYKPQKPMDRSTQGFISSTTSRPTKRLDLRLERATWRATMEQPDTPPRELTLEEAVALAILLQKNEQLVEAAGAVSPRARHGAESS